MADARHPCSRNCLLALLLLLCSPARADIRLQTVVTALDLPVRLVAPPGDPRLFVVELGGLIRVFDQDGTDRGVFLDVSDLTLLNVERGLLGLAFPDDYATSGRFYVSLTDDHVPPETESRIYRYQVSADPDLADASSGELVFTQFQPASNHNGGHIEFGPDGMLYLGLGDGGGYGDVNDYGQDLGVLYGKMLRLDVSGPGPAAIPPDNPFVGQAARGEIWARGFRNPWCFSFDRLTGDLYIADVGETAFEEINVQPAGSPGGENYGWSLMEGSACFDPPADCDDGTLVEPAHEYTHAAGRCSVSGGYVYRGSAIPDEQGAYFFADFCSGEVWSLRWSEGAGVTWLRNRTPELTTDFAVAWITSFGQDAAGELYVIEHTAGRIHRIVEGPGIATEEGSLGRLKRRW